MSWPGLATKTKMRQREAFDTYVLVKKKEGNL